MSLHPREIPAVPEETTRVARAAFPAATSTCPCVTNWGRSMTISSLPRYFSGPRTASRIALAAGVNDRDAICRRLVGPTGGRSCGASVSPPTSRRIRRPASGSGPRTASFKRCGPANTLGWDGPSCRPCQRKILGLSGGAEAIPDGRAVHVEAGTFLMRVDGRAVSV
jgi:hypothetical protein